LSFKKNILANYVSQLYVTAAGIIMVPMYIQYMGAEAYGLVGFFAMLQVCFGLLDAGLTPAMARESARFQGGASTTLEYRRLTRVLEGVFFAVALFGGILMFVISGPMARGWLKASELPTHVVIQSLQLIAFIVALRWMSGLYRGVITGAERLVWLSGFNSLIATGRFVLVLPLLIFVSASPMAFFAFQLGIAVFELVGLACMAYRLLPRIDKGQYIQWEWGPLKLVLKFALPIAFTSSLWILVTQTDKLILSKILPLADYGYFTVAVLVAGGIVIASSPISSAIMPRMTRLYAEGENNELIAVYRQATQIVTVTTIPIALLLIFFAPQILWVWTGDTVLMERAAPVLSLYSVGYAFLVFSAFPYYLQYAKGDLRLHIYGSVIFLLILIPLMIGATIFYGMIGAGWAWLISNIFYFFIWIPMVHIKLMRGSHWEWLLTDIIRVIGLPFAVVMLLSRVEVWHYNRIILLLQLFAVLCILVALAYSQANKIKIKLSKQYFTAKISKAEKLK
jgi:O-antigen/teichoic acid export membrane protein